MESRLQTIVQTILSIQQHLIQSAISLALLASSPFSTPLLARDIILGTIPEKMRFDQESIHVEPNEAITLTFVNTCRMQHNWILCQPGKNSTLQVATATLQLGAEAISKQYVPDSPLVIIATPLVNPNDTATIRFRAPLKPGRYPYVCTLPGHATTMRGILLVGEVGQAILKEESSRSKPTTGFDRAQEKMKIYRPIMDGGPTFAGVITNREDITPKGIAVRLGERRNAGALFDTELMRYSAAWTGGFIQFQKDREDERAEYRARIATAPFFQTDELPGWSNSMGSWRDPRATPYGPLPDSWAEFLGHYLYEEKVLFHYRINGIEILDHPEIQDGELLRHLSIAPTPQPLELRLVDRAITIPPHSEPRAILVKQNGDLTRSPYDLQGWIQGGPRRWPTKLVTQGTIAPDTSPYVVDTLTLPFDNPWNALLYTSGLDFFSNGDAALCTSHGDVWTVSGIDDDLDQLVWNRFASGLSNPLGLKIVNDQIYVVGLDQITRFYDLNHDGEADYYECFNNDCQVSERHHRFATDLQTDSKGNFYYLKCTDEGLTDHAGSLIRISPDGKDFELYATGLRNPNGMSIGPNDLITFGKQQGGWIPSSAIHVVRKNEFYGYMPSHHRDIPPTDFHQPLCWIPHGIDNSSGGQVWAPEGPRWGPLGGHLLHLSYGKCQLFLVLQEIDGSNHQGGIIQIPGIEFESGAMRARFREQDGQLYVTGLRGWQTTAVMPGCLQRVRYTGQGRFKLPEKLSVETEGIRIRFREGLDKRTANDPSNYQIEQWNYRWTKNYGSPEFKLSHPDEQGRDRIVVESVILNENDDSVLLILNPFQPAMQTAITYSIEAKTGAALTGRLFSTIHEIPKNH